MATWGYPALKIELEDEAPANQNISAFVTTVNGWKKSQILEELTAAGDDDERWGIVGIGKVDPIVLTGPYDDTAPNGLWDVTRITWAQIRVLQFTFDDPTAADVQFISVYIENVEIKPERGKLHALVVTLQPTGAVG